MKDLLKVLGDVVRLEEHTAMFCSALQHAQWYTALALGRTKVHVSSTESSRGSVSESAGTKVNS